jgi:anti-sigma regulatory factor (Ser/Thr protein kinase)
MTAAARHDGTSPVELAAPAMPEVRWRQVYGGEEAQIPELRRWIATLLPECAAREDVVMVAVELATNAVRHTASGRGGWFAVEVAWHRSGVLVLVGDQGAPSGPRLVDDPDPLSESGRGLHVVNGLSARTGVVGDRRGRLVWADVPWAGEAAPGQPAFPNGHETAIGDGQDLLARRHGGVRACFGPPPCDGGQWPGAPMTAAW